VSGVFSEWQPKYASHGIATFPVGEAKKPSIRSWQKIGLKGSAELAEKFIDADALGYVTGRRSNITVLDIDTTDEKIAEDAIRQHGQPAIIIRTASGKFHYLYRYNGEHRRIRPWPELPIDQLGDNGYALAAPSKIATGSYEIIHGHLRDLDLLKPMAGGLGEISVRRQGKPVTWSEMRDGDQRNEVNNGPTLRHWSPDLRVLHLNRRAPMASRGAPGPGSIFFMFVDPRRRAIRQHQGAL